MILLIKHNYDIARLQLRLLISFSMKQYLLPIFHTYETSSFLISISLKNRTFYKAVNTARTPLGAFTHQTSQPRSHRNQSSGWDCHEREATPHPHTRHCMPTVTTRFLLHAGGMALGAPTVTDASVDILQGRPFGC